MTDLTAITTPFGLLDRETQEALKAARFVTYEKFNDEGEWDVIAWPAWSPSVVYRVKPAPPKPRERWATSQILHETREEAEAFRAQLIAENPGMDFPPIVRFIEAID